MTRKADQGTYVYGIVAAPRRPAVPRAARGLAGAGPVRLLSFNEAAHRNRLRSWVIVADVPLSRYDESGINSRLSDLDWVARAAMAHEGVVEAFLKAPAVLPMKLFTIFTADERALEDLETRRPQIESTLKRVANHDEWGVRIVLNSVPAGAQTPRRSQPKSGGASYLERKRNQRRAAVELVTRSREVVDEVFEGLAAIGGQARRRPAGEMPASNGALLIDAVFLVPRSRSKKFQAKARREAARLRSQGYELTLTGPWPAYSFMDE
jgi:Gas vesicle synthesis protein GvpL/GvpF